MFLEYHVNDILEYRKSQASKKSSTKKKSLFKKPKNMAILQQFHKLCKIRKCFEKVKPTKPKASSEIHQNLK
jgi:hypothetical protein